jgi:hypothetical protein
MQRLVPIPDNLTESADFRGELIVRRWRRGVGKLVGLGFFCVIWNSFLIFWYTMAFGKSSAPLLFKIFPLGHVAVGVGLTYFLIASIFNRTEILVTPSTVGVRHRPLPWRGNRTVASSQISQVFVREASRNGSHNNAGSSTYEVHWLDAANRQKPLIKGLADDEALFIQARLEDLLKIEHQPVVGAYRS